MNVIGRGPVSVSWAETGAVGEREKRTADTTDAKKARKNRGRGVCSSASKVTGCHERNSRMMRGNGEFVQSRGSEGGARLQRYGT
ncbi:MAG: hypothetical protein MUO50_18370, partial [Longimicrobiales bacterium]|nr:hypothetical protein [Longimicrobiales bacterium]